MFHFLPCCLQALKLLAYCLQALKLLAYCLQVLKLLAYCLQVLLDGGSGSSPHFSVLGTPLIDWTPPRYLCLQCCATSADVRENDCNGCVTLVGKVLLPHPVQR